MKQNEDYNQYDWYAKFLGLICFITNISQMPSLVESQITRLVAIPIWIIAFLILIVKKDIKIRRNIISIIITPYIFIMGVLFCTILTYNNYLNSSLVYPYCLCIFIFFIGYLYSEKIEYRNIKFIIYGYIISSLIISIDIYIKYFSTGYNWISRSYIYGSKNSISQILLTGLVLLFIFYHPNKLIKKIIKLISCIFIMMIILMLKSRASIIGMIIMIVICIFYNKDIKVRKISLLICSLVLLIIIANKDIYNIIIDGILLGGRDASNLNDISSGRWDMIIEFPKMIANSWLIGKGNQYIESFILSAFLQHGILFGIIIIATSVYPVVWAIKWLYRNNRVNISFIIISISYCVNGLFEELAPFGPGVKCYLLWLLFGILYNWKNGNEKIG